MKAIKQDNQILVFKEIPRIFKRFPNIVNYNMLESSRHLEDGWQDIDIPEVTPGLNYLSTIKEDADGVFYYTLIEFTDSELEQQNESIKFEVLKRLNIVVSNSRLYAKAIVMGKSKNDDLDYFKDVYNSKYEMCKSNDFDTMLLMEANAEGFDDLEIYKNYVIQKFESGSLFFEQAKSMLEVFRKIVLKDLEDNEINKANALIKELDDLPDTLRPEDFADEFQRILFG